MGYIPPTNENLQAFTNKKLEKKFNDFANRYIPLDKEELIKVATEGLEATYREFVKNKPKKKSNTFFSSVINKPSSKPDKTRLDQLSLIRNTCNDLLKLINGTDKAKAIEAQHALNGVVFYRRVRILNWYKARKIAATPKNCALHLTIVELFKIADNYHRPKKVAVTPLDPHTLATSCIAYRDYLNQEGVKERYPYLTDNKVDYDEDLDDVIKEAEREAKPIKEQLDHIAYIKSVCKALQEESTEILRVLTQLADSVMGKAEDLGEGETLNARDVSDCLTTIVPESKRGVIEFIKQLIPPIFIVEKDGAVPVKNEEGEIESWDFLSVMKKQLNVNNKYTLIGAYLLSLNKCKGVSLGSAIREALNVTPDNQVDLKYQIEALEHLEKFMARSSRDNLEYDAWDSKTVMNRELTCFKGSLKDKLPLAKALPQEDSDELNEEKLAEGSFNMLG